MVLVCFYIIFNLPPRDVVEESSTQSEPLTLNAPVPLMVDKVYGIDLLLLSRECNKTYVVERSYNAQDWITVGTTTFYDYPPGAGTTCPKDFIDPGVASGTMKVFYRYGLLPEQGGAVTWSAVGEVSMEKE